MEKVNWWMVTALSFGAVIILMLAVCWVTPDQTDWGLGGSIMYGGTPRMVGVRNAPFMPLMFLMPFAWLVFPIFGVVCKIRWIGGGQRWRYFGTGYEPAAACSSCGRWVDAAWQVCPHCGQKIKGGTP